MKIGVIGVGYVGLTQSVAMASYLPQHTFIGYDIDNNKIDSLNKGIPTIFENQMEQILQSDLKEGNLKFTSQLGDLDGCEIIFIAVGTPTNEDGKQDKSYLNKAFLNVINNVKYDKLCVVIKSTVMPGTCESLYSMSRIGSSRNKNFVIANNPEFLREGYALFDFLNPDKVIIGIDEENNPELAEYYKPIFKELYQDICTRIVITSLKVSQACKYVNNDMLATKIAKVNEYRTLFKDFSTSEFEVLMESLGYDSRISNQFLNSGPGFGGSCFPKDTLALTEYATDSGFVKSELPLLYSTLKSNNARISHIANRITGILANTPNRVRKITVLGTAFKAGTDDIRESPAIKIIKKLTEVFRDYNFTWTIYDPKALDNTKKELSKLGYYRKLNIRYTDDHLYDLIFDESDVVIVLTEWPEFKTLLNSDMKFGETLFIDTRNIVPDNLNRIQL